MLFWQTMQKQCKKNIQPQFAQYNIQIQLSQQHCPVVNKLRLRIITSSVTFAEHILILFLLQRELFDTFNKDQWYQHLNNVDETFPEKDLPYKPSHTVWMSWSAEHI